MTERPLWWVPVFMFVLGLCTLHQDIQPGDKLYELLIMIGIFVGVFVLWGESTDRDLHPLSWILSVCTYIVGGRITSAVYPVSFEVGVLLMFLCCFALPIILSNISVASGHSEATSPHDVDREFMGVNVIFVDPPVGDTE